MKLYLDIETRAVADLRKVGVYVYAEHAATEITMVAWSFGDGQPASVWFPAISTRQDTRLLTGSTATIGGHRVRLVGGDLPAGLADGLRDPAVTLVAHNAGFERLVLGGAPGARILPPDIIAAMRPLRRWNCTAARAACMGLPRTLEAAGGALGFDVQKDKEGHSLMMRMCKPMKPPRPRKDGSAPTWPDGSPVDGRPRWLDDDTSMIREAAYCAQDVLAEIPIDRKLLELSSDERETWALTEKMNDRGVLVDADLLLAVMFLVDAADEQINAKLALITNGAVQRVSDHGAITRWLQSLDADDAFDGDNLGADGVGKAAIAAMLERVDLSPLVRQVLHIRKEGGKSSASKYRAILERMSADGRIRGVLVYCGAASTGRYSSRGAQLHNLPRPFLLRKGKQVDAAIRDIIASATPDEVEDIHGPPLMIASELLRPVFGAPATHWLARGDSKQIEARVSPWIAGDNHKLDAFRSYDAGTGPDLYKIAAAGIYEITPDEIDDEDPRRQVGKVSDLSLGFQGGVRALQQMAKGYGVRIPAHPRLGDGRSDPDIDPANGCDQWIVNRWRAAHPRFSGNGFDGAPLGVWRQFERAAIECMEKLAGAFVAVGDLGIGFRRNRDALAMRLPSGRWLFYWSPELVTTRTPFGEKLAVRYRAEDSQSKRWAVFTSYGGLWFQNAVQATARELMAHWLKLGFRRGLFPVLTVHDEGIFEALRSQYPDPSMAKAAVLEIMRDQPAWSAGLPVNADASAGPRYVK